LKYSETKKMTKQNEYKLTNFWVGLAAGAATMTGLAFLLGTKQGRGIVKKLLRFSENLEENLEKMIEKVDKQQSKKKAGKEPQLMEDVGQLISKIKQVTNHY